MDISDLPTPVGKYYRMDPNEDGILFDGTEVKAGMIVLVESQKHRLENEEDPDYKTINAWCEVSQPTIRNGVLKFIGTYADGWQTVRAYAVNYAWLVKKDSFPEMRRYT